MKWLKKNWLKILVVLWIIGGAITIIFCLDVLIANKQYKENQKNLKSDILQLERKNKVGEIVIKDLLTARAKDKVDSDKAIVDLKSNQKRELARIGTERDEWRAKVKEMPPSVVVTEIRTVLKTDEVWERPNGILFSLVAARDCLAMLGDFSLVEERDQWRDDYFEAMGVIGKKDEIIAGDEILFKSLRAVNFNLKKIGKKKDEKFSLSEKRNVQMYWKGIKHGAPFGGGIVLLIWLVFGK